MHHLGVLAATSVH